MQPQNIYITVSVEDELPTENKSYFVMDKAGNKFTQFHFEGFSKDIITHWLKPIEGVFVFTREELGKILERANKEGENAEYENNFGKVPPIYLNAEEYINNLLKD